VSKLLLSPTVVLIKTLGILITDLLFWSYSHLPIATVMQQGYFAESRMRLFHACLLAVSFKLLGRAKYDMILSFSTTKGDCKSTRVKPTESKQCIRNSAFCKAPLPVAVEVVFTRRCKLALQSSRDKHGGSVNSARSYSHHPSVG